MSNIDNVREIPFDVIQDMRWEANRMGFWPASEIPGYDLIGKRGEAALIERATEELVILRMKIVERNGRPWVHTYKPRDRKHYEYVFLGWRA